jgi:hypothetical protein
MNRKCLDGSSYLTGSPVDFQTILKARLYELRCKGRIVHERGLKDGWIGYRIEIEQLAPPLRGTREKTAA